MPLDISYKVFFIITKEKETIKGIIIILLAKALERIAEPFNPKNKATKSQQNQSLLALINVFAYLAGTVTIVSVSNDVN